MELRIVGPDLEVLRALGHSIRNVMADAPDIPQATTQIGSGANSGFDLRKPG